MRLIFLFLVLLILSVCSAANDVIVTRSFSDSSPIAGDTVTVRLQLTANLNVSGIGIIESVPAGWGINLLNPVATGFLISANETSGNITYIFLEDDAVSRNITYSLESPRNALGDYEINGSIYEEPSYETNNITGSSTLNLAEFEPIRNISGCTNLSTAGVTYLLTTDLIYPIETICFRISASNITLDCQNHLIKGTTSYPASQTAIYSDFFDPDNEEMWLTNITIKNCRISDWPVGLRLERVDFNSIYNFSSNNRESSSIILRDCSNSILRNLNLSNVSLYLEEQYGNSDNNIFDNVTIHQKYDDCIAINHCFDNTFTNLTATECETAIMLEGSSRNVFRNITVQNNEVGFSLQQSMNNTFIDVVSKFNSDYGFNLDSSVNNTFSSVTSISNQVGFRFADSDTNTIKDSAFGSNGIGIQLTTSGVRWPNSIYNNYFNNNTVHVNPSYTNNWNTTASAGQRTYSNGTEIGGNYWGSANSSANGFSDTCTDSTGDGFCDSAYNVSTNSACIIGLTCGDNADYLPYSRQYGSPTTTSTTTTTTTTTTTSTTTTTVFSGDLGLDDFSINLSNASIDVGNGFDIDLTFEGPDNTDSIGLTIEIKVDDVTVFLDEDYDLSFTEGEDKIITIRSSNFPGPDLDHDYFNDNLMNYVCDDVKVKVTVNGSDLDEEYSDSADLTIGADDNDLSFDLDPEEPDADEDFTVTVLDEDDDELSGATVKVTWIDDPDGDEDCEWDSDDANWNDETDAQGEVEFNLEDEFEDPEGEFQIDVYSEGYCLERQTIEALGETTTTTSTTTTTTSSSTTTTLPGVVFGNYSVNVSGNQTVVVNISEVSTVLELHLTNDSVNGSLNVTYSSENLVHSSLSVPELGRYVEVEASQEVVDSLSSVMLKVYYTDEEVHSHYLNESTLGIYWFNTSSSDWVKLTTNLSWVYGAGIQNDSTPKYIWANVSHFSDYAAAGDQICPIRGDYPNCSDVTLREVVDYIQVWIGDEATLSEVVRLINAWANS
jgi:parallel beta-helix repeat protein